MRLWAREDAAREQHILRERKYEANPKPSQKEKVGRQIRQAQREEAHRQETAIRPREKGHP